MGRIFSNGPLRDFVVNTYTQLTGQSTEISIAAPYVTRTAELVEAAQRGKRINLLVGLNAATSPAALSKAYEVHNIRIRYYTHRRFHAKIYLFDTSALLGSSNLTDPGLQFNREAMVLLTELENADTVNELRAVFSELWEHAPTLTADVLARFAAAHTRYSSPDIDSLIGSAVGQAEPPNINLASRKVTRERLFLETLRRQVSEYRNAFREVEAILDEGQYRRPELDGLGSSVQTNRFLSWVRQTYAPGDLWASTPPVSQEDRRARILELVREWASPEHHDIHGDYVTNITRVVDVFASRISIEESSQQELMDGLIALQAFGEQLRFVKGGLPNLPEVFWSENDNDLEKVKKTLTYLTHGTGEFTERLHDVLYDRNSKLKLFGMACALELYGTVRPRDFPPVNGRILKALRYVGFDIRHAD